MWPRLSNFGVSGKFLCVLKDIYSKATVAVDIGRSGARSEPVRVSRGVLQGDPASPLLFFLYIADMVDYFRKKGLSRLRIGSDNDIIMLQYADDVVILADSVPDRDRVKLGWRQS
ncbi:uncharacterized protein LOC120353105 [Nilaparvata lugens]|uniref:uncharacterized protein LOC120353105 n=1 Tax=Nilaparvata lugens TaxID=108931 RepID=UPI00193D22F3|nr:uncharacterized protein LOC120353105 [Nilaparvata lugens]